ncbi:Thioredoxin reductase [Candidatus Hydrogenisulfobacillus filiaventi]|uniref:Thioredoxin reductase n=1 Tax=Candidatus Hydrogenisulfobacillus filiaventi TaxID=2707344 RepID=A0A6F8ZGG1_9FIRM|nr:thioredoxin-disulfide reductase [Bacillota bacterium]CAB1128977.1 Thioredoxin reductase [Candidatus Hydrogenisulfobacillus filiaventi]
MRTSLAWGLLGEGFGGLGGLSSTESGETKVYDLAIIGGGPAGLTAGVYAARSRINGVIFEQGTPGGQIATTEVVANYPGFTEIGGLELAERMEEHVRSFGMPIVAAEVMSITLDGDEKVLETADGTYRVKAVIIATGANPKQLGVPGEDRLRGRGVSYCATCDGAFFKDRPIVVVGGGDSAIKEGLYLTKFGTSVTVVHRRDQLRAEKAWQEEAFKNPKMHFVWDTVVEEIEGQKMVERIRVRNVKTQAISYLEADAIFIYVGMRPNTGFVQGVIDLDEQGYIIADERTLATSVPGIFAAGDVRQKELRQVATAVGDGSTAAVQAEEYLEELKRAGR